MLYFEEVESSLMIVEVKSRSNISRIKPGAGYRILVAGQAGRDSDWSRSLATRHCPTLLL